MRQDILDLLAGSIGTGELVTIIYNGGKTPGKPRFVLPLTLSNENMRAKDHTSGVVKSYKVDRIASAALSDHQQVVNFAVETAAQTSQVPVLDSLSAYAALLEEELMSYGWHVVRSDNDLAIYPYWKNGKPKKTPVAAIYFSESSNSWWNATDLDKETLEPITGDVIETKQRSRPWCVTTKNKQSRSFKVLHHAIELFLREVRILSTTSNPPPTNR